MSCSGHFGAGLCYAVLVCSTSQTKYSPGCHKGDQCLSQDSDSTRRQEMVPSTETVMLIAAKQDSGPSKTLRARIFWKAENRQVTFFKVFSSNELKNKPMGKDMILDL